MVIFDEQSLAAITPEQFRSLQEAIKRGARFLAFPYCVSLVVITMQRRSHIYFVEPNESLVPQGIYFSLLSAVFGWWGIPWGPIYTLDAIIACFRGGRNVTNEVMVSLRRIHKAIATDQSATTFLSDLNLP
jgi:hypothetical protein